jgi:5-methyltetrahydropteroyltriglutamate--homocysteine methyltransferase
MPRTTPPFRADHVGSLLRATEDAAIAEVVRMQEDVGLQSATDGELRRASWHMDFIYQLGGIAKAQEQLKVTFRNPQGTIEFTPAGLRVHDKVHLDHTIFGDDFQALEALVTTATPKLTIPSPSMVHYRGGRAAIDPGVYPDIEEFWSDLSAAYAEQVRRLGELGCTYLQFDNSTSGWAPVAWTACNPCYN